MLREGYGEEEMYLILDGVFEAKAGERRLAPDGQGRALRRDRLLRARATGGRLRSRPSAHGRVLALRGKTLRQLIDAEPAVAAQLLLRIGAVMAQRLAGAARKDDDDAEEEQAS